MILFIAPYGFLIFKMKSIQAGGTPPLYFLPLFILLMLITLVLTFYIVKLAIENVEFKDKSIVFNGTFGRYIEIVLFGLLLSIMTLGIYLAWFIRDLHRFYINNSSFNDQSLLFNGKGGKLFVIFLLTIFLPIILFTIIMAKYTLNNPGQTQSTMLIQQLVMLIIMIPYMYLLYKWRINITYKDFSISWETDFWPSCGKIVVEIILSVITIGIYMPLAMLRLYKYFAEKTFVKNIDRKLQFGYDIDQLSDFLFIWGQVLLTLITLGIYYPWAFSKIGGRILGKTYLIEE